MSQRTRGWIGIDVGSQSVKVAQLQQRGERVTFVDGAVVPRRNLASQWNSESPPVPSRNEILVGRSLADRMRGGRAACMLSMALCEVRGLQVDPALETDLRPAVESELSAVIEDLPHKEFDFWMTNENDPRHNENVQALVISKRWTEQTAADLQAAGLHAEVLDGEPLALARALELARETPSSEPALCIDWGFSSATFCIVVGNEPRFVRALREVEFSRLMQELSTALGISMDEAQKVLVEYGLPSASGAITSEARDLQGMIREVATEPLKHLFEEVNRTLAYLSMHRRALTPTEAWLFGGGGTIRNISEEFASSTNLPTRIWALPTDQQASATRDMPQSLFGPAAALSALAWSA